MLFRSAVPPIADRSRRSGSGPTSHELVCLGPARPSHAPLIGRAAIVTRRDNNWRRASSAGVLCFPDNRYKACTCPPVIGERKRSSTSIRSVRLLPAKRSSIVAGNRSSSTGGMKLARAICQNGAAVKISRHHLRQRSRLRRSTPTSSLSRRILAAPPSCRTAMRMIVAAR